MDKGDEPRPVLTTNEKPRLDFGLSGAFLFTGALDMEREQTGTQRT
jgi:hypothetical protein